MLDSLLRLSRPRLGAAFRHWQTVCTADRLLRSEAARAAAEASALQARAELLQLRSTYLHATVAAQEAEEANRDGTAAARAEAEATAAAEELLQCRVQLALREERERRVAHAQEVALRRMRWRSISEGWSTWCETYQILRRRERLLRAAAGRLLRPRLAHALWTWREHTSAEPEVQRRRRRHSPPRRRLFPPRGPLPTHTWHGGAFLPSGGYQGLAAEATPAPADSVGGEDEAGEWMDPSGRARFALKDPLPSCARASPSNESRRKARELNVPMSWIANEGGTAAGDGSPTLQLERHMSEASTPSPKRSPPPKRSPERTSMRSQTRSLPRAPSSDGRLDGGGDALEGGDELLGGGDTVSQRMQLRRVPTSPSVVAALDKATRRAVLAEQAMHDAEAEARRAQLQLTAAWEQNAAASKRAHTAELIATHLSRRLVSTETKAASEIKEARAAAQRAEDQKADEARRANSLQYLLERNARALRRAQTAAIVDATNRQKRRPATAPLELARTASSPSALPQALFAEAIPGLP